ncbi:MAG: HEAT repeat domain-containing protein [Acidobacteriota bacterium]
MHTRTWLGGVLVAVLASAAIAAPKDAPKAQPAKKDAKHGAKKDAKKAKLDLAPLAAQLASANAEEAVKAAETLGSEADPAAHDALLDALAFGLPGAVAVPAIQALAKHPAPPDVPALRRYANHRNPAVRSSVLGTLALYPDPAAHALVIAGMHDPVGIVRAAACSAAAAGRVRESVDTLFQLLARGEEPAARALAQLADADLARKIGDQLGKVPDASLSLALGTLLKRADFGPDAARVEVVRALAKISDASATAALTDYIDATPKNPPRESRQEAEKIVTARLGGGAK